MADISFYHLTQSRLEDALRALLGKALSNDKKVLLYGQDLTQLKQLDAALWESPADSFLPHGLDTDDDPEFQPILLTNKEENLNEAEFIFAINGASRDFCTQFERCFDIFDGNNPDEVNKARGRWKDFSATDAQLHYWKQVEGGKWQKEK